MNWLRRLFRLHVHQWGPAEIVMIPGGTYVSDRDPRLTLEFKGRRMTACWCPCGKYKNIY